jgi:hypothetical protein
VASMASRMLSPDNNTPEAEATEGFSSVGPGVVLGSGVTTVGIGEADGSEAEATEGFSSVGAVVSGLSGSVVAAVLGVVGEEEEGPGGGSVSTEGFSSVGAVVSGPGVVLGSGVTTVGIGEADGSEADAGVVGVGVVGVAVTTGASSSVSLIWAAQYTSNT